MQDVLPEYYTRLGRDGHITSHDALGRFTALPVGAGVTPGPVLPNDSDVPAAERSTPSRTCWVTLLPVGWPKGSHASCYDPSPAITQGSTGCSLVATNWASEKILAISMGKSKSLEIFPPSHPKMRGGTVLSST